MKTQSDKFSIKSLHLISTEKIYVKNGRVVRLKHMNTHRILHYENYIFDENSDSKNQVVCTTGRDYNDWWKVELVSHLGDDSKNNCIYSGSLIKLQHYITGKYLTSDLTFNSQVSHWQGVKCDKVSSESSENITNNIWSVVVLDEETWESNSRIKLIHFDSGALLYSDFINYKNGDQEVVCSLETENNNENDIWITIENCEKNEIMHLNYDQGY